MVNRVAAEKHRLDHMKNDFIINSPAFKAAMNKFNAELIEILRIYMMDAAKLPPRQFRKRSLKGQTVSAKAPA